MSGDGSSTRVAAHVGDGAVLLAFNLEQEEAENLAGFSIKCRTPSKGPYPSKKYFLKNMLGFGTELTKDEKLTSGRLTPSNKAPFQEFHWIHFPGAGPGKYEYTIYASRFKSPGVVDLKRDGDPVGVGATVEVDLAYRSFSGLELGFTRGYISSQAYVDRFDGRDIRPKPKSIDFDTRPYEKQYQWLGSHARRAVLNFLKECQNDRSLSLDVSSFDLDSPDIIKALCAVGSRLRVFQDNAPLHTAPKALEPKAVKALKAAGAKVETGHFARFAHNKVLIQKRNGRALKVLTGSANFSIRGLFVQANSVLVIEDQEVANLYERSFEQSFTDARGFKASPVASKWHDIEKGNLPRLSVSFAPHRTPFTLDKISEAIASARSSVFFAVMEMGGTGPALVSLQGLADREDLFSMGVIESRGQLKLFKQYVDRKPGVASFAYLRKDVPAPFKAEWSGGAGQVIHHKFVVCDFNGNSPVVFCGSSNLAAGGETSNGDNLIAIYDRSIATFYSIEAMRLYDHYRFRSAHEQSTSKRPLMLDPTDGWTRRYYDPRSYKFRERQLLSPARVP